MMHMTMVTMGMMNMTKMAVVMVTVMRMVLPNDTEVE